LSTACLLCSLLPLRRPPSPTLFPYTTLFRSGEQWRDLRLARARRDPRRAGAAVQQLQRRLAVRRGTGNRAEARLTRIESLRGEQDRKSTRLNSSHVKISYAVFCLKKKNRKNQ